MKKKSENTSSADNQQETTINHVGSSETTRETPQMTKAYLLGAIRDSTETKYTYRISQKGQRYPSLIAKSLRHLGYKAWVYKEGKSRNVFVVEFAKKILKDIKIKSEQDKIDFVRGYFDTDGGIAKSASVRYYIYFCQKDKYDLEIVKNYLQELGIKTGKMHNPSFRVDPNYWRFYISKSSYDDFYFIIGSLHPDKKKYLRKVI